MTPFTTSWCAVIVRDLREGFGVEDIAVRHGFKVNDVRDMVASLHRSGAIRELYAQARKEWRRVA